MSERAAGGYARPDHRVQRRTSPNWVEFEDPPPFGRYNRITKINAVHEADEPETEWDAASERTEDVAEVPNALHRV